MKPFGHIEDNVRSESSEMLKGVEIGFDEGDLMAARESRLHSLDGVDVIPLSVNVVCGRRGFRRGFRGCLGGDFGQSLSGFLAQVEGECNVHEIKPL